MLLRDVPNKVKFGGPINCVLTMDGLMEGGTGSFQKVGEWQKKDQNI